MRDIIFNILVVGNVAGFFAFVGGVLYMAWKDARTDA